MTNKLIEQGAEAKIYLNTTTNTIIKERIQKTYRHKALDTQLRKQRTKKEAKILHKAQSLQINTPKILNLNTKNEPTSPFILELEYINGEKLSNTLSKKQLSTQKKIIKQIAQQIGIIHNNHIIHADLTTANILYTNKPHIIDFGLGYISPKIENKAVDLHLLKHALEAHHSKHAEELFQEFLDEYQKHATQNKEVIQRLKVVEKRGRYKQSH